MSHLVVTLGRDIQMDERGSMRKLIIAVVTAAVALVTFGCTEEITPELVDQTAATAADHADDADDADATAGPYRVGDTVSMGELEHTLHGVRWSGGDDLFGPDEGERWLVVDVELTNTGDSSEVISSIMMWTLIDADNRTVDMAFTGDEQGSLDGELGAGRSIRGETAFSVTDDGESWELVFEPELFGFGQAIYDISSDDVSG